MTIKYIPFESRTGFKSPGFEVTPSGNIVTNGNIVANGDLVANSLNVLDTINAPAILLNGVEIFNISDSSVSLGDNVINSSLERIGTLDYLNVAGDVIITQGSSWTISVVNGKIILLSGPEIGTIDNIDIGQTTPALGQFTTLTSTTLDVTSNTTVGGTLDVTGAAQFSDITINNQPTELFHATRKDYVDNTASAFAIAFGA